MPHKDPQIRKDYERERKNKKRIAQYMLLPEPERSRKLAANARRRSYQMRWTTDRVKTKRSG